jgi:FtsH-binding integral membrane protein
MPSLIGSSVTANYLKNVINQADVGRELIVSIASSGTINDAELNAAIAVLTTSHGTGGAGDSAFTVAAVGTADGSAFVSGTTATVFLRCQGTGTFTAADVKAAAEGAAGGGAGTFTVSTVAVFQPAK